MGQIFTASAYDVEKRVCCAMDADKFHANCYSHSGTVASIHYLLRQQPYNVIWGGGYVVIDDNLNLEMYSNERVLLGISTYMDFDSFKRNNDNIESKPYYDKVKFIDNNSKQWKRINVWNEAIDYFNLRNTWSVKYTGYLLNHNQKKAVDLADYYEKSASRNDNGFNVTIDLIPALTETGGGTEMALFDGITTDTTHELVNSWCGDLLQISDDLPHGYDVINCCFAELWSRSSICYDKYGVDSDGFLIANKNGKRFEAAALGLYWKRGAPHYMKIEVLDTKILFKLIPRKLN